MARKCSAVSAQSNDAKKIFGPPSPLDKTEPPIYRQVIQYSYFLVNCYPQLKDFASTSHGQDTVHSQSSTTTNSKETDEYFELVRHHMGSYSLIKTP